MLSKDTKIDWQTCALALNRKLNMLTARLQQTEHTSTSFDVVSFSRSLREEFHLETDSDFVNPDFEELLKSFDDLKHRLFEYQYFANRTTGDYKKILDLASDISLQLAIHGAFV